MNQACSTFLVAVFLIFFDSVQSFSLNNAESGKAIPFAGRMLPAMDSITVLNSSAIQLLWRPSPVLDSINITQLSGKFTVSLYAGTQIYTFTTISVFEKTRLNETGSIVLANLTADIVYHVCFQSKWYEPDAIIDDDAPLGIKRNECQLLRTYATNATTLRPVPPLGEYTWKQGVTGAGALAIIVNTSVSLELPYQRRTIIVQLDSQTKSKVIETPLEDAQFMFDQLDSAPREYPLVLIFELSNSRNTKSMTNTLRDTLNATGINKGDGQLLGNSLLLIFLLVLVLL